MAKIKAWVEGRLSCLVFIFIVLQPFLDVLSYFLEERGDNTISTLCRFALLGGVALLGFYVSNQKKHYYIIYGIIILFWILHCVNCYRIGYQSVVDDTKNYLRIISLPIYTLSLITFFKQGKHIHKSIYIGFAVNFALIIVFTAIPWISGNPVFTYEELEIGVMGWFSVRSAQSAVISIITPITIFFAYKTKNYIVYIISLVVTMGLLFLTGTKLTYYSILLLCVTLGFMFVLNLKKKSLMYVIPLFILFVSAVVFKSYSPTSVRASMTAYTQGNYQELVEGSVEARKSQQPAQEAGETRPLEQYEMVERARKSIFGVYTSKAVYGPIYKDINDRFGVYNVMNIFNYSTETSLLSDNRERKHYFAKLVWNEKDTLTHLLGFEYSDMIHGDTNYDLENDFPAVFYFNGYIGFGLYILYFIYFIFIVIRAFLKNIKGFLTIETGIIGISFILSMGAAQISGNVLRRPNVTAYFALISAYVYFQTVMRPIPSDAQNAKEFIAELRTLWRTRKARKKKALKN